MRIIEKKTSFIIKPHTSRDKSHSKCNSNTEINLFSYTFLIVSCNRKRLLNEALLFQRMLLHLQHNYKA